MECDYRHCRLNGKERVIVSDGRNYFTCLCTGHFHYLRFELNELIFDIEEITNEKEVINMPIVKTGVKKTPPKADELPEHIKQHVKTASKKVDDEQTDNRESRKKNNS